MCLGREEKKNWRETIIADDWYLPRPWNKFSAFRSTKDALQDFGETKTEKHKKWKSLKELRGSFFNLSA